MDQYPQRDRYSEEIARIREIVGQHPRPPFVTGFDVQLGEFDGDRAMWITFWLSKEVDHPGPDLDALQALRKAVSHDVLDRLDDRFPYFRFHRDPSLVEPAR